MGKKHKGDDEDQDQQQETNEVLPPEKEHTIGDVIAELRKDRPDERLIISTMDKLDARDGTAVYDPLLPVLREQKEKKPALVKELYHMLKRQHDKETAKDRLRAKNDAQLDR